MEVDSQAGTLKLPLPHVEQGINFGKRVPIRSRTALYVPEDRLTEACRFEQSLILPDVLITRDVLPALKTVANFGEVGKRFEDETLEQDPTKKQVIFYAAIVADDHLLWYQRAGNPAELLGDPRLLGRYSMGFGGHKTAEDIAMTHAEQLMLGQYLMQGLDRPLERALGAARGLFAEVEEEIGARPT